MLDSANWYKDETWKNLVKDSWMADWKEIVKKVWEKGYLGQDSTRMELCGYGLRMIATHNRNGT
jgi:hypothetical protein